MTTIEYAHELNARNASLDAERNAMHKSPLSPFAVAYAVGREALEHAKREQTRTEAPETPTLKRAGLLGCWVDGVLRFQSRDHGNVHDYAQRRMAERHQVWVTPVGSFVDK